MKPSFTDFYTNALATSTSPKYINKGITHFEDLHVDDVIRVVENLNKYRITEKLDGSHLVFGRDLNGHFFTSRESKQGQRFYNEWDYPLISANNTFRAAHAVLEHHAFILNKYIKPGMAFEAEILGGRQPNAIVYGSSKIVIVRAVQGDNEEIPCIETFKTISKKLHGMNCHTNTPYIGTRDGTTIINESVNRKWEFRDIPTFQVDDIDSNLINEAKNILNEEVTIGNSTYTKRGLINLKLNKIKVAERGNLREARELIQKEIDETIKQPFKRFFINQLNGIQSQLCDVFLESHEDIGIEGLVLFDSTTHEQIKIVDKDNFTAINQFNFAIRNQISGALPKPIHESAKLSNISQTFIIDLMEDLADTLKAPQLRKYIDVTRKFKATKGSTPTETANNFAESYSLPFNKEMIMEVLNDHMDILSESLNEYQQNWNTYSHTNQNGRTLRYTPEIHDRTLLVFAETFDFLKKIAKNIEKSSNSGDIIHAIYRKQLKKIHV